MQPQPRETETEHESTTNEITPHEASEILRCFPNKFNFILPESSVIPDLLVDGKPKEDTMRIISEILRVKDYKQNRFSYWMLDVLQEIVVDAQRQQMAQKNQITTINWFLFVLKQIQLTALPRRCFFLNLEEMLRTAEKSMVTKSSELIPQPWEVLKNQGEQAFFVYDRPPSPTQNEDRKEARPVSTQSRRQASSKRQSPRSSVSKASEGKSDLTASQNDKETLGELEDEGEFFGMIGPPPITEKDLLIMVQLLYDIFADRLSYEVIREVYCNAQFNPEDKEETDQQIAENGAQALKDDTAAQAGSSKKSTNKEDGTKQKESKRKSKVSARKSKVSARKSKIGKKK